MSSVEAVRSIRRAKAVYKTADGELVPGVTTILALRAKPALYDWYFRLGRDNPGLASAHDYVDDLARIGQCAHERIAARLASREPDLSYFSANENALSDPCVEKFGRWMELHDVRPIFAETPLVSEEHRFGGTPDLYATVDGVFTVVDWKTGRSGIYDEYRYQVAAYAELLRGASHEVQAARILRVGRTEREGFAEETVSEWSRYWSAFLTLRALYQVEFEIRTEGPGTQRAKEAKEGPLHVA